LTHSTRIGHGLRTGEYHLVGPNSDWKRATTARAASAPEGVMAIFC
jgi:hypothetical protein